MYIISLNILYLNYLILSTKIQNTNIFILCINIKSIIITDIFMYIYLYIFGYSFQFLVQVGLVPVQFLGYNNLGLVRIFRLVQSNLRP